MSGKFALIIANTEYTDPGLAQLTAPGKDAKDFGRVLDSPEIGAFDDVITLVNENASKVNEAIDYFFSLKKPDDLLVLYFSGHGVRDEYGSLYLAVKNTIRARLRSTAIKSDFIREAMDQSRSKRQVLILDCCNSGAYAQGTKAATGVSIGTASAFEGTGYGRVVLTASDSTQFAWEGDKIIGETDNSLFTHYLVKGLEGEADNDGDGRITIDELYDYAYERIVNITPKQTPGKWSYKQQGEIVLRQSTRIENIKPMLLPEELISEIKDLRPYVREAAVLQLEGLLKGRNLGLARSAREALEKIAAEDDSRRVAQAALQALESIRQEEQLAAHRAHEEKQFREQAELLAAQKAEEERIAHERAEEERIAREELERRVRKKVEEEWKAQEEAKRLASQKAEEERLAAEIVESDRKSKEETERLLAAQRAEEERIAKAKIETERLAKEQRLAAEKAEAERKAKEENERLLAERAEEERIAKAKAEAESKAKEKAQRLAAQKSEDERIAYEKAEAESRAKKEAHQLTPQKAKKEGLAPERAKAQLEAVKRVNVKESEPVKTPWITSTTLWIVVITLVLFGFASRDYLSGIFVRSAATQAPVREAPAVGTKPVATATEAPGMQPVQFVLPGKSPSFSLFNPNVHKVYQVAFSPDGRLLASASSEGIQLWNVSDGTLIKKIDEGNAVSFSPDGKLLAYSPTTTFPGPGEIKLWRISDELYLESLRAHTNANNEDAVSNFVFSPDGKLIASTSWDNTVRLWNISDSSLLRMFEGQSLVAFSPDGQILASDSSDNITNTISLWQVSDGTLIKEFNSGYSNILAFSPDGQILASGYQGIILWDLTNGTKIKTLDASNTVCIAFSPDGQKLASSGFDKTILVWRISDGVLLDRFEGHKDYVSSVVFSRDGTLLASGSEDGTVRLWEIEAPAEHIEGLTQAPTEALATEAPVLGIGSTMIGKDGMTLVYVPAGEFTMGSDRSDTPAENPVHTVYLDAFWIDQTEVTNEMYAKCVADSACTEPADIRSATHPNYYGNSEFDNYPVIYVDWNMAKTYCGWAGRELPTEAEWEKAARGTDRRTYPWGENIDCDKANYQPSCIGDTTKVGSYPEGVSPYGVYELAGNVWEWVNDWYSDVYYQSSPSSNPSGPNSGTYRVLRGGMWESSDYGVRSAFRFSDEPAYSSHLIGFRCSRSP